MADPTAGGGTEGLREALARIIDPKALEIMGRSVLARCERWAVLGESIAYRKADEIIAGPLADFLARASAERARVEVAEANLNALARMYGEACGNLAQYRHAAVEWQGEQVDYAAAFESRVASLTAERDRLLIAFHDAIRRPLGVTPDSGAEFYSYHMADEAEARRPRHGSPEDRAERPEIRIAAALAALDDACRMSSILLMAGEMTAQERRTAKAVANGIAAKVRSALKLPEAPDA